MDERATGLILRCRPFTETSLIVHWLTPSLGRVATAAKGARRPQSAFRGKLDLFYQADFSFARSRRSDLHTLREVHLLDPHRCLRTDLAWLRQAVYGARLIERTTETETPLPALYRLLETFLADLPLTPPRPLTVLAFELKLLAELGLAPNPDLASLSPGSKQVLRRLAQADWTTLSRLQASPVQLQDISRFLHGFLVYHLGGLPPGRARALCALEDSDRKPEPTPPGPGVQPA